MLWSRDNAHLSVARDRPGPFEIDVPGPPTACPEGAGFLVFSPSPVTSGAAGMAGLPGATRGSSGSHGANSPRMEIVSVMRRNIAVGMLGLALAGCAQSRSSLPGAASRGQPIGMEPVPSINDTINRGTGDPALVQATLPDPKSPNWSGEFIPPRGPAGTPPGPQVARPGPVQASASSTDSPSRASAPASAVLASPSSPPPASAAGLLAGAGMPAAAADPQAAQAPTAPPVQTLPSQQPGMGDLEVGRSPGEVPPTAAAAGSPSPDQALPPIEEPRADGAPGAPLEAAVAPAAAAPTAAPNPLSAPTPVPAQAAQAPRGPAAMADQLLGPDPDLMPAIDLPPPAPAKGKTTQRPEADAAAKSVPSSAGAAGASGDFPLETAPELPVDPQPIRGSLSPAAPAANPAPTTQNGQAGAPSASTASVPDRTSSQTAAAPPAPRSDSMAHLASFNPDSLTEMAIDRNWKRRDGPRPGSTMRSSRFMTSFSRSRRSSLIAIPVTASTTKNSTWQPRACSHT